MGWQSTWRCLAALTLVPACVLTTTGAARSDEAKTDKSIFSLINPTPDGSLRTFSADRPLNAFTPFTVDAGRVQVESDFLLFGQSSDRLTSTQMFEALDPEIRVGLTQDLEVDVSTAGLLDQRTVDRTGRTLSHDTGTGPVTVRARYNVFGNDGGKYAFALSPFLSIPSGDTTFSSGKLEGGVTLPLSVTLPSDFTLVLETQVQALHDTGGAAYASFTDIANLSHAVPGVDQLTASVEFTAVNNVDRSAPDIYTFETALAYLVTPTTQLDLGGFIGLNRAAPDFQVSAGIAHRF